LKKIWATQEKIYVFNKIDMISKEDCEVLKNKFSFLNPLFISTYLWEGIEELKQIILQKV
jgi:50S ribosomal subunit-associated GTPase HflX